LLTKILISIVEDDVSVREALTGLMKSFGFNVKAFQRAQDFLKSDRLDSTSCLISDVQMPGMTGLDLYNRLVTSGKPIPTILITAYPDAGVRARALRAGVKSYLAKPFSEGNLLACIHSALDPREPGKGS
jgi:FixJ family two-component response regulator